MPSLPLVATAVDPVADPAAGLPPVEPPPQPATAAARTAASTPTNRARRTAVRRVKRIWGPFMKVAPSRHWWLHLDAGDGVRRSPGPRRQGDRFGIELTHPGGVPRPLPAAERQQPVDQAGGEAPDQHVCLLYTSPSPRDRQKSRMPSS